MTIIIASIAGKPNTSKRLLYTYFPAPLFHAVEMRQQFPATNRICSRTYRPLVLQRDCLCLAEASTGSLNILVAALDSNHLNMFPSLV